MSSSLVALSAGEFDDSELPTASPEDVEEIVPQPQPNLSDLEKASSVMPVSRRKGLATSMLESPDVKAARESLSLGSETQELDDIRLAYDQALESIAVPSSGHVRLSSDLCAAAAIEFRKTQLDDAFALLSHADSLKRERAKRCRFLPLVSAADAYWTALAAENEGELDEALRGYLICVQEVPDCAEYRARLASIYLSLSEGGAEYRQCEQEMKQALSIDPHCLTALKVQAKLLQKQYIAENVDSLVRDQLRSVWQKVINLDPDCSEAFVALQKLNMEKNSGGIFGKTFKSIEKYFSS